MEFADITLAILAGGAGSRMGRPKGELAIGGKPILEWILSNLRWSGPTLLVTAPGRKRPPGWRRFDVEVSDPVAGLGPLRGIITALENARTDRLIVSPVDMPFMAAENVRWLASQQGGGVLLRRTCEGRDQIEPLPLLVHRALLPGLRTCLEQGRKSVRGLATEPGFRVVDAPVDWHDHVWTNLNFPGDMPESWCAGETT